ncbi:MAG: 50S ribosomal protein L30, partial [Acidimicrobiales bacterium]
MSPSKTADQLHVRVTQVRSQIATKPKHRATLRALGLRGVGRSRVFADSESLRGMLSRVGHLVEVQSATADEMPARTRRSDARRAARVAKEAKGAPAAAPRS